MKKILIVSHDATRTGAPILLLNLSTILKKRYEIHFLLKRGGVLEPDFKKIGRTWVATQKESPDLLKRFLGKFSEKKNFNLMECEWTSYQFVISNTITNGDILVEIKDVYKGPIFSYIHELEMATNFFTSPENLHLLLSYSTKFFVPCNAVKEHLVKKMNVPKEKISYLPYFLPSQRYTKSKIDNKNVFIVGGVGTADWRKSPDLFIIIAKNFLKKIPEASVLFLWKGAPSQGTELERLNYDIKKAGLQGKVRIEEASEMGEFYSRIDLFLLTSREDPYPLVVLEAADANVPILSFKESGGAPEFITNSKGGKTIPYLDIEQVANEILYYYNNETERLIAGSLAKQYLSVTHQDEHYVYRLFEDATQIW